MTRRAWLLLVVLALSTVARADVVTSTVRGYLFRVAPNGQSYAAANIPVRLTHPQYGPSSFAYSGFDGMFYLYNVPPGSFVLEVWISSTYALRYPINVDGRDVVSVSPIRVP